VELPVWVQAVAWIAAVVAITALTVYLYARRGE
jgi:hypothetical protein